MKVVKNNVLVRLLRHLGWQIITTIHLLKFSGILRLDTSKKNDYKVLASIHSIEKGLTMPNRRLGFGKNHVELIKSYINSNVRNASLKEYAVDTINQYNAIHSINADVNSDQEIKQRIFSEMQSDFDFTAFAKARMSVRNFTGEIIEKQIILECIELAKTAPSSCNRQGVKVHVLDKKSKNFNKILQLQGGNRGFSQTVPNIAILTFDLNAVNGLFETNMPFVDGGYFAMNFSYALLEKNIASVPLNCNFSYSKGLLLRKLAGIPKNEVFIVIKAFGYSKTKILVPKSKRVNIIS